MYCHIIAKSNYLQGEYLMNKDIAINNCLTAIGNIS